MTKLLEKFMVSMPNLIFKPEDFKNLLCEFTLPHAAVVNASVFAQQIFDAWIKENGKVVYGYMSETVSFTADSKYLNGAKATHKALLIGVEPLEKLISTENIKVCGLTVEQIQEAKDFYISHKGRMPTEKCTHPYEKLHWPMKGLKQSMDEANWSTETSIRNFYLNCGCGAKVRPKEFEVCE